jgi:methionine--tRNA ligase beta chain
VSAAHAVTAEVRLYDRLFSTENPGSDEARSFLDEINPDSLETLAACRLEPSLAAAPAGARFQFERLGYFCVDPDSAVGKPVFNRTVTLKDTWAKIEAKSTSGKEARPAKAPTAQKAPVATTAAPTAVQPAGEITIDDFTRVDLRVGVVRSAATVEEAKKLIRLQVDLGDGRPRQIFAGLRAFYPDPQVLVGKRVIVVANLKPRQMKFGVSEGMILAAGSGDRPHLVATFDDGPDAPQPGDKIA